MLQPNVKFLMFNYIPSVKAYIFLMSGFVTNALLEIEQLHKTVGVNVPHVVHCLLKQRKTLSMLHDPFVGDIDIYITLGLCTGLIKGISKFYLIVVGLETDTLTDAISFVLLYIGT